MAKSDAEIISHQSEKKIRNAVSQSKIEANSIVYGKVVNIWDTEHPGMVRVKIHGYIGDESNEIWAKVAAPYCGNDFGVYSFPEVGAEVIVAFMYGDSGMPVIIGSIWNNQQVMPESIANEENTTKKIITKGGNEITIEDKTDNTSVELKTKGKLYFKFDDAKKNIIISDEKSENKIELDCENGNINVDCKTKISLKIGGNDIVTIESKKVNITADNFNADVKKTTINASQSVGIKGGPVKIEGTTMDIKANSKLAVESSGICQVKGSLLKLN